MPNPIPVICDRCRAEGLAGAGDFADFGDLLDFEPVTLQVVRIDGWNAECQRAFIAALSVMGSADRAARAVGKSGAGAERLRRLPGAESFVAAWDRALAIARERGTLRLATTLKGLHRPGPAPPPPQPAPEPDAAELAADSAKLKLLERLLAHYLQRLAMEREARLAGKVVEADFYVRQVTVIEVCIDLASDDAWRLLCDMRLENPPFDRRLLVEVAETPMSRLLDEVRRAQWAEAGEPERPPLPPPEQLIDHGRYRTGAQEVFSGPDLNEQKRAKDAEYRAAARAQVEWEEKARREAAEWRKRLEGETGSSPAFAGEGERACEAGPGGLPTAQPDAEHRLAENGGGAAARPPSEQGGDPQ